MKNKEIKEYLEKGFIKISTIFEIIGHPKKHVEDTMKAYIANIKTDDGIKVISEEYEDAEEIEKDLFSIVADVSMLIKNFEKLTWLAINFSPASIEIMEPDKVNVTQRELNHYLNDLLSKMHEIGIVQKQVTSQNQGLIRNFNAMTRNAILLVLKEPADIATIGKKIGMGEKHTTEFVEALIKEKKIVKDKNKYRIK